MRVLDIFAFAALTWLIVFAIFMQFILPPIKLLTFWLF